MYVRGIIGIIMFIENKIIKLFEFNRYLLSAL